MPIFDYKCPNCERKVNDIYVIRYDDIVICSQCKAKMSKLVPTMGKPKCFPADGIYLEHVGAEGKRFHSEKEMRQFEKETGTTIGMLH